MATRLYKSGKQLEIYDCNPYMTEYLYTHRLKSTEEQWNSTVCQLSQSCWIYIGNLQYHISEQIVYSYFSKIGIVDRLIFGVNRNDINQKIGFAFIKYLTNFEACSAVNYLNDTILLNKSLNVQLDPGFEDGRQFGRGKSGHQRYKEKEIKLKKIEKKLTSHKFKQLNKKKQNMNNNNNNNKKLNEENKKEDINVNKN
eukprot:459762_1